MNIRFRHAASAAIGVIVSAAFVGAPLGASGASADDEPVLAYFEGEWIDLSEGWGEATACHVDESGVVCFRTQAELDEAYPEDEGDGGEMSLMMTCSSTLRLYSNTSYGGLLLALDTQGLVINLGTYGFSNIVSSYKVGACGSWFYDGIGTGQYPGNTSAGAQASSMLPGWDNRISSVFIW